MKKCMEIGEKYQVFLTKSYIKYIINTSDKLNSKRGEQNPYNSLRGVVFFVYKEINKMGNKGYLSNRIDKKI